MRVSFDIDELLRQQRITPAEAERLRRLGAAEPSVRQTRGLMSIVVPSLLGIVAGELTGALLLANNPGVWPIDRAIWFGALQGAWVGLLLGGVLGVCRWAFFPYLSAPSSGSNSIEPGSPAPEDQPEGQAADPGKCPACGAAITPTQEKCATCEIALR